MFNALNLSFDEVKFQRNPQCLLCGENATIKKLIDYPLSCQSGKAQPSPSMCGNP